jgi:dTDP-4-amino-4,6-dideoxygalactose transaminase
LKEAGIATGLHYPIPVHLQPAYAGLGYREGDFPISEQSAREVISLPMFPTIRDDEQTLVADSVRAHREVRVFAETAGD